MYKLHTYTHQSVKEMETFVPEYGLSLEKVVSLTGYKKTIPNSLILNFAWIQDMGLNNPYRPDHLKR